MTKVFLSYRHEADDTHPEHQKRVKELGRQLRIQGLDVVVDQIYVEECPGGPDEGWPSWCEGQASNADKILMVASAGYFRCFDNKEDFGKGLGAACEINVIRNKWLYGTGYKPDRVRVIYFDKTNIKNIPDALSHIHRFWVVDAEELKSLVAWLKGDSFASSAVTATATDTISWPPPILGYLPRLADRQNEFAFFVSMIAGGTRERVLFLEGPSGHGKTKLVAECLTYAQQALSTEACVAVDFKSSPTREVAWQTLSLGLASTFSADEPNDSRGIRHVLRRSARPTLLLFDTFEQASTDARELITLLLTDLYVARGVCVVVAGQSVPEHTKTIWADWVRFFSLLPINNTQDWLHYTQYTHPQLQAAELQTLTRASGGTPGVMITLIRGLAESLRTNA